MRYLFRRGHAFVAHGDCRVNPEILSWMTLYPAANAPFLRTPVVIAAILITPRAQSVISSGVNAKAL